MTATPEDRAWVAVSQVGVSRPWSEIGDPEALDRRARIDAKKVEILSEYLEDVIRDRDFWQLSAKQSDSLINSMIGNLVQVGWFAGGRFLRYDDDADNSYLDELGWVPVYAHSSRLQSVKRAAEVAGDANGANL